LLGLPPWAYGSLEVLAHCIQVRNDWQQALFHTGLVPSTTCTWRQSNQVMIVTLAAVFRDNLTSLGSSGIIVAGYYAPYCC